MERNGTKRQIIQLLSVILAAFLVAGIALGGMVYYWSPIGTYLAKNVLLSPEVADQMVLPQYNAANGEKSRVVFDRVLFTYYDKELRQFKSLEVNRSTYDKFYHLVGNDRSLREVSREVVNKFGQTNANLVIEVRNKISKERMASPFQEVTFAADGDHYRVDLHEDTPAGNYAYFYHPQIYPQAKGLFLHE